MRLIANVRIRSLPCLVGTVTSTFEAYFDVEMGGNMYSTTVPIILGGLLWHKPSVSGEVFTSADRVRLVSVTGFPSPYTIGVPWLILSPCVRCGDIDSNGSTDMADFAEFAGDWLWTESGYDLYSAADMDCSGDVKLDDLADFVLTWLAGCP